jgi:hypothetical protein
MQQKHQSNLSRILDTLNKNITLNWQSALAVIVADFANE